jgi:DNA-binding response OmpR family regulator
MTVASSKGGNILVVDDMPENLRILAQLLATNGYTARPVRSGQLALEAVTNQPPDLILLDINMSGTDGYEVCEQLKAQEDSRHIPVIFVTARTETIDKVRAFGLGVVDYVIKPFEAEEVLARVETHLELRRAQLRLEQALAEAKTLRGIVPIFSGCKNIRDDDGFWQRVDIYVQTHTEAQFSHGLCEPCIERLYPELTVDEVSTTDR